MRKRKVLEAMEGLVSFSLYSQEYQDAKADLDIAVTKNRWTIERWRVRQEERRTRVPRGHDHPEWV